MPKPPGAPAGSDKRSPNQLSGRALKVTVVLSDAAELLNLQVRDGQPRVKLRITAGGHVLTADISAKSARRAIAGVREHGSDGVTAIVQGKLVGSRIEDCGLVVQPKGPPRTVESP